MLTQERLKELVKYDEVTGLFTWLVSPRKQSPVGSIAGSLTSQGYIQITLMQQDYLAHRLAVLYMTGEFPKVQADHKDLNRTNNAWLNLRCADRYQQARNTGMRTNNTSGVKGVSWHKKAQKYCAELWVDGKKKYLGLFVNLEDAEQAINAARLEFHGDFARAA